MLASMPHSASVVDRGPASQVRPMRNVLLVDDSDFERVVIRSAVEGLTNFRICGEASNGASRKA
jgi:hypothetical protein